MPSHDTTIGRDDTALYDQVMQEYLKEPDVLGTRPFIVAYKQFRKDKSGNLHPLFVYANEIVPTGKWIVAKEGMRDQNGKIKSKLGPLAYRPGWHLSEAPYAPHIGMKENGKIRYMKPDTVWAMCLVNATNDYTVQAKANGMRNGKFDPRKACLTTLPENGFYWFNTNPSAFGNWLITDGIFVLKVLTDEETERICWTQFHIHAQPRKVG